MSRSDAELNLAVLTVADFERHMRDLFENCEACQSPVFVDWHETLALWGARECGRCKATGEALKGMCLETPP